MSKLDVVFPNNGDEVELALLKKGIIIIHGNINDASCEKFLGRLLFLESIGSPPALIRINTGGGNGECACLMHDALKLYQGETTGLIIGRGYSSGSIILQACKKRQITRNSKMLIHYGWNKYDNETLTNPSKRKKLLKKLAEEEKEVERFYMGRSKADPKKIRALLKKDCPINAEEALALDLVDEIVD